MQEPESFADLVLINRAVASAFDRLERRPWTVLTEVAELAKQVGDLARAVLSHEQWYLRERDATAQYAADRDRIGDELADVLYCLLRLADRYGVDLAAAHRQARQREWEMLNGSQPPPWEPSR